MHKEMIDQLVEWGEKYENLICFGKLADLGAYNINGAVKDTFPKCIGFDICEGKGVDVVIVPGVIPPEHQGIYDVVFCVNALNASPNTTEFVDETSIMLKSGGLLFLAYRISKVKNHSVSPNSYGYKWRIISDEEANKICDSFTEKYSLIERKRTKISEDVFDEVLTLRKL
jgi:hypothetical protein